MRVLLVNHTLGIHGGTEGIVENLSRELGERDIGVRVLESKNPFYLYLKTRQYESWADIINFFNFPATLGAFPCSKPVVWNCYDIPEEYSRWWKVPFEALNRNTMRLPGRYVVVISELSARRFERLYKRQVDYIVPLGVDWDFFSKSTPRRGGNIFRILHVGAVGKFKNQLDSVFIFKDFQQVVPESTLTFVGPRLRVGSGPEYWTAVEDAIKGNGLQSKVKLLGELSKEELRNLYYSSDVLLHPVSESTGTITLSEALCTGLPAVTSKAFVGKQEFGIATEDYLDGLKEVYWYKEKYGKLAEEGGRWVRENLSTQNLADRMVQIFEEVLGHDRTYKRWWMREVQGG